VHVAPPEIEHMRVVEPGRHIGEGLAQRRQVQVGVRLRLGDVGSVLQCQNLPGILGP